VLEHAASIQTIGAANWRSPTSPRYHAGQCAYLEVMVAVPRAGYGTHESLLQASHFIETIREAQAEVACLKRSPIGWLD